MIEILIPTFNRAVFLEKNLNLLIKQIDSFNLEEEVSISISDNCSEDETAIAVKKIINKKKGKVKITLFEQRENIGLEKNAVFLLGKSSDKYIMYLGDDDFLPDTYLEYLIEKIQIVENLACVIPGFSGLFSDGTITPNRNASFNEKIFEASFKTALKISQFGHQLSGILVRRQGLYKSYVSNDKLRNIYPFIFFVAYNNLQGYSIYAPKYQVLVSQDNSKNWKYDDSGLLTEIFKNYNLLFQESYIKRNLIKIFFINQQAWRIRIADGFRNVYKAFIHLEKDPDVEISLKLILPIIFLYRYTGRFVLRKILRLK